MCAAFPLSEEVRLLCGDKTLFDYNAAILRLYDVLGNARCAGCRAAPQGSLSCAPRCARPRRALSALYGYMRRVPLLKCIYIIEWRDDDDDV